MSFFMESFSWISIYKPGLSMWWPLSATVGKTYIIAKKLSKVCPTVVAWEGAEPIYSSLILPNYLVKMLPNSLGNKCAKHNVAKSAKIVSCAMFPQFLALYWALFPKLFLECV